MFIFQGFRNRLEVTNYPLLPESQYLSGTINEAINWRRLEQRLEMEEKAAFDEANNHALRVLLHEMHFMPVGRRRLYMKSV